MTITADDVKRIAQQVNVLTKTVANLQAELAAVRKVTDWLPAERPKAEQPKEPEAPKGKYAPQVQRVLVMQSIATGFGLGIGFAISGVIVWFCAVAVLGALGVSVSG